MSSDRAAPTGELAPARLFAAAWAVAALFHLLGKVPIYTGWSGSMLLDALVGACALGLLVRPSSLATLLTLAGAQVAAAIAEAPVLSNHWLLAALVNLALLAAAAALAVRSRRAAAPGAPMAGGLPLQDAHWRLAAPIVRWQVILFYLLAALHKTNSSYLDPEVSCAALYSSEIARSLGAGSLVGTETARLAAWGSLLIEWAIPVLLLVPRLRLGGVLLGVFFHGVLALDLPRHFFDFSSVMYALLLAFLPARAATWAARRWSPRAQAGRRAIAAALFALGLASTALVARAPWALPVSTGLGAVLWFAWAALLVAGLVVVLRRGPSAAPDPGALAVPRGWLWILPALVLVNGIAPYLGWKTGGAFNMYSNLRVEGDRPNHLFLPGSLRLSRHHGDLVAIVSSSDPELHAYGQRKVLVPFFELRDYLSRRPHVALAFERNGELHELAQAADDPELVAPVPWWLRKLLLFRPVDSSELESCRDTWGAAR
ncbi:MAG TPA: HTTM domain-containing protein [Thermoanaerobaculia bacterium]|nr:HTTM domain-containing protein [Thermoanaerobaculia bacterium]